ncbi:radical S-adenosyl methionine domain-containing protein 2 [Folsomia candida]|uniref:Radical S-adenosyl methionine domain-containing protein 2 n=1 Tax=Folsomia candida TaxID=158441 RepID=A0A226EEE0_FOLCA|nr:radical S-adenosyl methionine domain-containing protein 2 [Folsomia candida]OXA55191.1 Radical S-adenosyl methionine domain-containing protein 2 [Folsomia candida]
MIEYWWHIALLAIVFWAAKVCIYRTQTKLLVVNGANQDEEDANKVIIPSTNVSTEETVFDLKKPDKRIPVSVNFHFTRKCNYECGFCFHTAKTSHITPLEDAKRGLKKMADLGMKKLNLSGGEPFLYWKYVGEICKYCKDVLKLESVSIVSNGSLIKERFFKLYGQYLDILAISVDSFDEETNIKIGRGTGQHTAKLLTISDWCSSHNVKFKLNTVVNRYNHAEDFGQIISSLNPTRWKCFQVLSVDTENTGHNSLRNCAEFLISDEEFENFCTRHAHLSCFVPESNFMMKSSYIILDEKMRFLNKGDVYKESESILDVDVEQALIETDWEPDVFVKRGGVYDWTVDKPACGDDPALQW